MEDIYGKVVSLLLGIVILFLIPVLYEKERMENLVQVSLMTETEYLVDGVCNTGVMTKQMFDKYREKLQVYGGCNIELIHTKSKFTADSQTGEIKEQLICVYEDEMIKILETEGSYGFRRGDFLRIQVKKDGKILLYYGGTITYENDAV